MAQHPYQSLVAIQEPPFASADVKPIARLFEEANIISLDLCNAVVDLVRSHVVDRFHVASVTIRFTRKKLLHASLSGALPYPISSRRATSPLSISKGRGLEKQTSAPFCFIFS